MPKNLALLMTKCQHNKNNLKIMNIIQYNLMKNQNYLSIFYVSVIYIHKYAAFVFCIFFCFFFIKTHQNLMSWVHGAF